MKVIRTRERVSQGIRPGFIWVGDLVRKGIVIQREVVPVHNITPDEGLLHLAGVGFKSATQVANWYVAPFGGNYTPSNADTAGATPAACGELTTQYDETTRQALVLGSLALDMDNSASLAEFTLNATVTIYGALMISSAAKGATTGVLMSMVRFASPKNGSDGDIFRLNAGVAFESE